MKLSRKPEKEVFSKQTRFSNFNLLPKSLNDYKFCRISSKFVREKVRGNKSSPLHFPNVI